MCDPVTAFTVVSVAATAMTTFNQYQAQRSKAEYDRHVGNYNARVLENQATDVKNKSVEEENAHRQKVARLAAEQRATFGAKNVDISSGSPLDIQQDTFVLGEADALRIKTNFQNQADALNTQASFSQAEGEAKYRAGKSAATGTLLSGVGRIASSGVADKWFTPDSSASLSGGKSLLGST